MAPVEAFQTTGTKLGPATLTLGVVAICHNEENDLPGFLDHLLSWVDEIIIVDDGSTDSTPSLAASAGPKVKFISSPRQPGEYYSHQRNKGIATARSDWLLHMDIDERVTPELAQEIVQAIPNPAKDAYRFRRLNFFLHRPMRGGGWQKWNQIHLARRSHFRFGGKMHETTLFDGDISRIGQLGNFMWHLNDCDYSERLRKSFVYCSVEAEDILESGTRVGAASLLFRPLWKFVKSFILELGFRDGVAGLISSLHCADAVFRSQALAWDRQNQRPRASLEKALASS